MIVKSLEKINFQNFRIYLFVFFAQVLKVTCSLTSHETPLNLWRMQVQQLEQTFPQKSSYSSSVHLNFDFLKMTCGVSFQYSFLRPSKGTEM